MNCPYCDGELIRFDEELDMDTISIDYRCQGCGKVFREYYDVRYRETTEVDEEGNETPVETEMDFGDY